MSAIGPCHHGVEDAGACKTCLDLMWARWMDMRGLDGKTHLQSLLDQVNASSSRLERELARSAVQHREAMDVIIAESRRNQIRVGTVLLFQDSGDAEKMRALAADLANQNAELLDKIARNWIRLGAYECLEHQEPQYGECISCDRLNPDESWRNVER